MRFASLALRTRCTGILSESTQDTFTVDIAGNHRGLNERGDLTRATLDSNQTYHGFLRVRDGTMIAFDAIAGLWFDANSVGHGFLIQPHGGE